MSSLAPKSIAANPKPTLDHPAHDRAVEVTMCAACAAAGRGHICTHLIDQEIAELTALKAGGGTDQRTTFVCPACGTTHTVTPCGLTNHRFACRTCNAKICSACREYGWSTNDACFQCASGALRRKIEGEQRKLVYIECQIEQAAQRKFSYFPDLCRCGFLDGQRSTKGKRARGNAD